MPRRSPALPAPRLEFYKSQVLDALEHQDDNADATAFRQVMITPLQHPLACSSNSPAASLGLLIKLPCSIPPLHHPSPAASLGLPSPAASLPFPAASFGLPSPAAFLPSIAAFLGLLIRVPASRTHTAQVVYMWRAKSAGLGILAMPQRLLSLQRLDRSSASLGGRKPF